MINVQHLSKTFELSKQQRKELQTSAKTATAVNGLSFECQPGRVFSLLGPPFLDKEFVNYTFKIPTHYKKTNVEKLILRDSFDGFLPDDILYREKEQFSDGVGYSWITSLKSYIDSCITDEQFKRDSKLYSVNTPTTKEALFYRNIYDKLFKDTNSNIIKTWTPKWVNNTDPSGVIQKQQIKN